jgi:hypothetical protein
LGAPPLLGASIAHRPSGFHLAKYLFGEKAVLHGEGANTVTTKYTQTQFTEEVASTEMCEPLAYDYSPPPIGRDAHPAVSRGFGQAFGLHPIPAVAALAIDTMLFGGTIITGGALAPVAIVVAVVLGYITYKSQMRFYGDDVETARIKALAVGLLTAIPVGLPAFLTVPSAVVGVVHTLRSKS